MCSQGWSLLLSCFIFYAVMHFQNTFPTKLVGKSKVNWFTGKKYNVLKQMFEYPTNQKSSFDFNWFSFWMHQQMIVSQYNWTERLIVTFWTVNHHIFQPLKGVWLCPGSAATPNSAFEYRSCVVQIACCQKPFLRRGTIMLNQRWCFTECFPPSHAPLIWFTRECDWWRSSRDVERVGF